MDNDTIYITSNNYHDALEIWMGGPGAYHLKQELLDFDHHAGMLHTATTSSSRAEDPTYMFRVLDDQKFQLAVLKYGIKFSTHQHDNS